MTTATANLAPLASRDPLVKEAISFAQQHLSGIRRSSGDTYDQHGIEVARTLEEATSDPALLAVAILHDVLVHPNGEELLASSPLTPELQTFTRRMHELRHLHIEENVDDLDRVIAAFTEDGRLLLLRMAHRLNDVRHLSRFNEVRRKEIARETLHMYTAISGRLGFHRWRWHMEDACFAELHPDISTKVRDQYEACAKIDRACLQHARAYLLEALSKRGITAEIDERIKGVYSSYRKMVLKERTFEELTDRLALRILVPSIEDCYRALGIVHEVMHPMHGKLKDYIGTPKENGYRSIHTVVYPLAGVSEFPIEVQIRTFSMHRECEFGVASHGNYKNHVYALTSPATRVNLFRNLENLQAVTRSPDTFTEALVRSFKHDRVVIFDPKNTVHHLPKDATAFDFVCQNHPEKCRYIHAVKINGRERSLDTQLRDGDTVEALFTEEALPMSAHIEAAQLEATKKILAKAHEVAQVEVS